MDFSELSIEEVTGHIKAYLILDPVTQCIRISWDVVFDEG
jgi:hypothetical protein